MSAALCSLYNSAVLPKSCNCSSCAVVCIVLTTKLGPSIICVNENVEIGDRHNDKIL